MLSVKGIQSFKNPIFFYDFMKDNLNYSYELKIPKDRVAVLIGRKGGVKKDIEMATNSRINVDSKEGDIAVSGDDPVGLLSAREVIKAIGRGFNPEIANLLLKQDYCFEILNITDYSGKSKKKMLRLKGRVIGEDGKTRRIVEELTMTNISVYGKTVCIIGWSANANLARRAVESLLSGAEHAAVYRALEKKRKELKMSPFDHDDLRELKESLRENLKDIKL